MGRNWPLPSCPAGFFSQPFFAWLKKQRLQARGRQRNAQSALLDIIFGLGLVDAAEFLATHPLLDILLCCKGEELTTTMMQRSHSCRLSEKWLVYMSLSYVFPCSVTSHKALRMKTMKV